MNKICALMNAENLDFQTFLIACLGHSKQFQEANTYVLLMVLERDWALSQKEILEQASEQELFEMATEELEQRRARIKGKIDLYEKILNESGLLTHQSVWKNAIDILRGIHGVRGLEIHRAEFDSDEYRKLKLQELRKLIKGGPSYTLKDAWPHSTEIHEYARSVYRVARNYKITPTPCGQTHEAIN